MRKNYYSVESVAKFTQIISIRNRHSGRRKRKKKSLEEKIILKAQENFGKQALLTKNTAFFLKPRHIGTYSKLYIGAIKGDTRL